MSRFYHNAALVLGLTVLLASVLDQSVQAQADAAQLSAGKVQGVVRDSSKQPVAGATVCLQADDKQILTGHTDSTGAYVFPAVHQGKYTLRAEMSGYDEATSVPFVLKSNESKTVDLTLNTRKTSATKNSSGAQPEFFDEPHFTVAGVTDTTNLGGHGSDV
ncbi:MAG: carboxypeptidase-like regulatory domain-containing protein, partial [Candidatus Sulfotelmatobacter sp.]